MLLNGVPGKKIICKRGVRQGDPLSPLLFVLAAELLQIIINEAWQNGDISLPIENSYGLGYPVIQYADDTLIIMPADPVQFCALKDILSKFSKSTVLMVNYQKSSLIPINISEERATELAQLMRCKKEGMPFTYLGLAMGTTRPKVDDFMPIITRVDKKLSGIASICSHTHANSHTLRLVYLLCPYLLCASLRYNTLF